MILHLNFFSLHAEVEKYDYDITIHFVSTLMKTSNGDCLQTARHIKAMKTPIRELCLIKKVSRQLFAIGLSCDQFFPLLT